MNTFPLEQKVCMITGGLGGFALSISELMLKRGARIWLCDLKQEEDGMLTLQNDFSEAFGKNNIGYCRCDVTSENEFDAAFRKCIEKMGETPDVLINAAGILGEEQWDNLYDINLVRETRYMILCITCIQYLSYSDSMIDCYKLTFYFFRKEPIEA